MEEDEDLVLQRASSTLLQKLLTRFPNFLWRRGGSHANRVHRFARQKDLDNILALIKPFQENPQLLDSHLTTFLPSLFTVYLHELKAVPRAPSGAEFLPLTTAISRIIYTFCEVRGYKVVSRFFNNEPHLIKSLSERLCHVTYVQADTIWEERYVLTLWMSHLLLAPFDLATIEGASSLYSYPSPSPLAIDIPDGLSQITERLVKTLLQLLQSPGKEREAAALALSRLCLRHDMNQKRLTDTIVIGLVKRLKRGSQSNEEIYPNLGILLFLERFISAAAYSSGSDSTHSIYPTLLEEFEEGHLTPLSDSALAKKLFIKILRHSAVCLLLKPETAVLDDKVIVLEQMINHLFHFVKDRDSSVRFAAGKALAVLVKYLQPSFSEEIIESILLPLYREQPGSLTSEDYSVLSHLESHGLTLTISLMLFQQSVSLTQFGKVLNYLHHALNFHQLSPAGVSIGSNVRDAACFGLWSLSRRYSDKHWNLPNVILNLEITGKSTSISTVQNVALELLIMSCLDPVGNIRRGASAALQELVGRNSDRVEKGISLIQIADYQAVGLRERAVCKVAVEAADVHEIYWGGILSGLLGWKGIQSTDTASRIVAATAIGRMCIPKPLPLVLQITDHLFQLFSLCTSKDVERIHGIAIAILSIVRHRVYEIKSQDTAMYSNKLRNGYIEDIGGFYDLFFRNRTMIYNVLKKQKPTGPSLGIKGAAMSSLLRCMAELEVQVFADQLIPSTKPLIDRSDVSCLLDMYLDCDDKYFLGTFAELCQTLFSAFNPEGLQAFAEQCLDTLHKSAYKAGKRASGRLTALGNMLPEPKLTLGVQKMILLELSARCTEEYSIPNRLITLQSIKQALVRFSASDHFNLVKKELAAIILTGLNDYTIDERGDIGSLVRLEALLSLQEAQKNKAVATSLLNEDLEAAVVRLAVEKMDKIRAKAAMCLTLSGKLSFSQHTLPMQNDKLEARTCETGGLDIYAVSSQAYFEQMLSLLSSELAPMVKTSLIEGYCSSAGFGSETLVHASRFALVSVLRKMALDDVECHYSIRKFADDLLHVLKDRFEVDRVVIPLMEVLVFLLDANILNQLRDSTYKWKTLFYYVQKSHYKSSNIAKLLVAVQIYRGLIDISSIRFEVTQKLISMLTHPFPKVRASVAECLFHVTNYEGFKRQNWTGPLQQLRHVALQIRKVYPAKSVT